MEVTLVDIICLGFALASFGWALIERSKRKPLWWTLKRLELSSMSNLAFYDEL